MTEELREPVTRAICAAAGLDWDAQAHFMTSASGSPDEQEGYLARADAAIAITVAEAREREAALIATALRALSPERGA